jgi:hypothetical protein
MKAPFLFAAILSLTVGAAYATLGEFDRKEGLWSNHTETINQPGDKRTEGTNFICRSHACDVHAGSIPEKANCKTISVEASDHTAIAGTECMVAGSVVHSTQRTTIGDTSPTRLRAPPALHR